MGTFNTVSADLACPRCGSRAIRRIQFKYGNLRLHEYKVGDQLVDEWYISWLIGQVSAAYSRGGSRQNDLALAKFALDEGGLTAAEPD